MKKGILFFIAIVFSIALSFGQGSIKGKVCDNKEDPLPFANIVLVQDGIEKYEAQTNFEGEFLVSNIIGGTYSMQVSFVGFDTFKLEGIIVQNGKVILLDDVVLKIKLPDPRYKRKRFFWKKK